MINTGSRGANHRCDGRSMSGKSGGGKTFTKSCLLVFDCLALEIIDSMPDWQVKLPSR